MPTMQMELTPAGSGMLIFEQITDMDIPEINAGGVRHSEIARRSTSNMAIQLIKLLKQVVWSKFLRPLRTKTASMPIS